MAYRPTTISGIVNLENLHLYLWQELLRISEDLEVEAEALDTAETALDVVEADVADINAGLWLPELTAAPGTPVDRQIVFADGTTWNPGHGRGYYWYDTAGTQWVPMGTLAGTWAL